MKFLLHLHVHPVCSLLVSHLFDGIAQGRAMHLVDVLLEEVTKEVHRDTLAHLTKHPSDSLVHQVVRMVQVNLGITEAP